MDRIYLDHAATTPLLPEAAEAMASWSSAQFGNPSSLHADGRRAKDAVDQAREVFSGAFGALFGEVLFTGSGSEACQLAIVGPILADDRDPRRNRILVSASEHHAVLHTQKLVERLGCRMETVAVDGEGRIRIDNLSQKLGDDVLSVSAMAANNETGAINPLAEIGELVRRHGALFHVDAVQVLPHRWRPEEWSADMVSAAPHKFYGPKGIGVLYVRGGTPLEAVQSGGGQERNMRGGTENVAGIVGAAVACQAALENGAEWERAMQSARDAFESCVGDTVQWTTKGLRTVGHSHCRLPGIDAQTMLIRLDRRGISASSGAACSSGSLDPSHVLMACGMTHREASEGLRFTFGKGSTVDQAMIAADALTSEASSVLLSRSR